WRTSVPEPVPPVAPLQEEYPSCPLCGGASDPMGSMDCTRHLMWHEPLPAAVEWMRCGACTHVHTRHYWTGAGLAEVFSRASPEQLAGVNSERRRQIWRPVVANVVAVLGGYAKIFDAAR